MKMNAKTLSTKIFEPNRTPKFIYIILKYYQNIQYLDERRVSECKSKLI
jgi:hypothetical protein